MEQIDMVDRQNLMSAAWAARAASISPSPCTRPASPVGAIASGIDTVSPSIEVASDTLETSTSTRWRRRIASRSLRLALSVISSYEPRSTYSKIERGILRRAIRRKSSILVTMDTAGPGRAD